MTFLANPHEVSFRFGDYIDEFQAILATNNIKHGAPDNFSTFARRLQSDELLSADLDRMVRSIIQRESGNVSLRTILTIIAIASGGDTIAEPDRDLSKPMQLVIDIMIASGGCSPDDPNHLDDLCRSTTPDDTPTFLPVPSPTPNLDDSASDLNQSLTRLERNAVEAKQYLDSIEQRISRIEPFFEAIPRRDTSASPQNVVPTPYPTDPPIPNRFTVLLSDSVARFTIFFNDSRGRFTQFLSSQRSSFRSYSSTFFSDTFTQKLSDIHKQFDTTLTTFTDNFFSYSFTDTLCTHPFIEKLLSYSFTKKLLNYRFTDKLLSYPPDKLLSHLYTDKLLNHPYTQKLLSYRLSNQLVQRAAAVPLSVAAIVVGTLLYLTIEHEPHSIIQPPTALITEAATAAPPIPATDHPQLTVYAEPLDKSAAKPRKPSPDLTQTATVIPSHPHRPIEPAVPGTTSSATASVTTPTPNPNTRPEAETTSTQATAHNAKYVLTSPSSRLRPSPSHTIDVSSGIMASNLVSAAPPTYPRLASLFHMQGKVVMQAIIAKNGTVQSLQVLQGHRLLRGAAKNAVNSWRYRPYLIDDKPVDVATIVTVDFNLPH